MENSKQNQQTRHNDSILISIRTMILVQAILFILFSISWAITEDFDKWFTRWAFGMLLLSAWGIMRHLSRNSK